MRIELPKLILREAATQQASSGLFLINCSPAPGETDVPAVSSIRFTVASTTGSQASLVDTRVWVNGVRDESFSAGLIADGAQFRFPPHAFPGGETIELRVVSRTTDRTYALDETYTFLIEDRTMPHVISAEAVGPRSINIGFDELVKVVDASQIKIEAIDTPAVLVQAIGAKSKDNIVTVTVDQDMSPHQFYYFDVGDGIEDLNHNLVNGSFRMGSFKGFAPFIPESRRVDLWGMLPQFNRMQDDGDLRIFVDIFEQLTNWVLADLVIIPNLFDIERADEWAVDLMLKRLGNPFRFQLSLPMKRRLAAALCVMYSQKGTEVGIKNAARFFLGIEVEVDAYADDTMVLGLSNLGLDWILGPDGSWSRYAFVVRTGRALSDEEHEMLYEIVDYLKPAHCHLAKIETPGEAVIDDAWVLGVSLLGFGRV